MVSTMKIAASFLALFALCLGAATAADSDLADVPPMKTLKLNVEGMTCEGCADYLNTLFKKVDGVGETYVSVPQKTVVVAEAAEKTLTEEVLEATVKEAGYTLKKVERTSQPLAKVKEDLLAAKPQAATES